MQFKYSGYNLLLSVVLLILLSSCEYSFGPEYYVERQLPQNPTSAYLEIIDLQGDTLWLWKYTNIDLVLRNFALKPKIYMVDAGPIAVSSHYNDPTLFALTPDDADEGQYQIIISAITSSGTNSIADKLGAEGWLFQREYVGIVSHESPLPKPLDFAYSIDDEGYLEISWNKYSGYDFNYYTLIMDDSFDPEVIHDPDSNIFVYNKFVGAGIFAQIDLTVRKGFEYTISGIRNRIRYYRADIKEIETSPGLITISWNKYPRPVNYSLAIDEEVVMSFEQKTEYVMSKPEINQKIHVTLYISQIGIDDLHDGRVINFSDEFNTQWVSSGT